MPRHEIGRTHAPALLPLVGSVVQFLPEVPAHVAIRVHGTPADQRPRPMSGHVGSDDADAVWNLQVTSLHQFLGVDVLEWYHPAVRVHLQKKSGRMGHPPDFDIIVALLYIVEVRFWGA